MLNVNQMIMKKVLNITEHKDGTYTLSHLTFEQMHAIQNALIQNAISLVDLQGQKWAEGQDLNPVAAFSLQFADEASDQLLDMGFWHENTAGAYPAGKQQRLIIQPYRITDKRSIMKKAKTYFRILVDDSPSEDFQNLDAALLAFLDPEYASIRNKRLVSGHWQGKGEWVNFFIDSVIL